MERLYAETFHSIAEGTILKGRVLALKQDGVIVDIGYKCEGFVPIVELSKETATKIKTWELLQRALQEGTSVEGIVVGKTKGGLFVNISGVNAFLPGSQIDLKAPKDIDNLIGQKLF